MALSNKKDELTSMEEGRSNIIVNLQQTTPGQTENSQQPSDKIIQCASLRSNFQSLEDAVISEDAQENDKPNVGKLPKIQKASDMLWRDKEIKKHFEPRMMSIGPLHHVDKFKLAEKLKLKLAALFIQKHQLDKVRLYNKINELIDIFRNFYIKEDIETFNNEDLAWMFLVDGCALLHYIDCYSKGKLRELKIKMDTAAFAQQDLFLLENQLPYQLLDRVLIKSIADHKDQESVRQSIGEFVDKIARNIRRPSDDVEDSLGKSSCWFTIIRRRRCPSSPQQPSPPNTDPAHLLELLWRNLVGPKSDSSPSAGDNNRYSFRNVNELQAAWIQFESNTSGSLRDIAFDTSWWFKGTLRLPSLAVDDSTEPMFLNLIAFEMCPDFENDFQVSSYISFLDSLIDQPEDVKDLRKAHILYNALGSDEQVARLFNEIGTDIVPNPQTYSKVRKDIQNHYKKKWNTWMGQAYHEHFSSPWTFVAFAGVIIALFMSAVQTWFTVFPK